MTMHTHAHMAYTCTHMLALVHTHTCTHMHTYTCTHMHAHTCAYMYIHLHSSIFYDLAELSVQRADSSTAIEYYCEALKKKHDFTEARLALAKLHLQLGDLASCDQECVILLRMDQDNEQASLVRRGGSWVKERAI